VASFEAFIFKDISFNFWMMSSLYLVVFGLGWFLINRNFRTSAVLLASVFLFQMAFILFDFNSRNKDELLVFQSKNSSLILERKGGELTVFSSIKDSLALKKDRNIQSYSIANGIAISEIKRVPNLIFYQSKKILILDSTSVFVPDLKPEILLITQSPRINFERIIKEYKPEMVIVDASNYRNVVEKIRKTCDQQKIPFHAVAEKGFYRIE
jgi:competence protein ComEC